MFSLTLVLVEEKICSVCHIFSKIMNILNVRQYKSTQTTWHGSLVGSVSASYASDPEIDPHVLHILLWKIFSLPGAIARSVAMSLGNQEAL